MQKYGSKRDKTLAAKGQAVREGLSVWEAEQVMDVELFLEGQTKWEADSPHCLMMLYKMFQHAADQGWKEVEQMVCQGCQHKFPKLYPEVDISTVQPVGPQTSNEEIQSLYLEVYKLQRLLGSPPESQNWWRRWCLPLKTTKGGNKGKHQKWQWGPSQQTADSQGAEPLGGGGEKPLWKEALPR